MRTSYATVTLCGFNGNPAKYTASFLVDTGAIDCVAPASELERIGIRKEGRRVYELADGRQVAFDYGLVRIEIMGETTAGRVVFGADDIEPILGVVALESAVLKVNPVTQTLEKLPASLLK